MSRKEPKFRHIKWDDRLKIEALWNSGHTFRHIAKHTGFSPSAICREVHRGMYEHRDGRTWKNETRYSATIAQDDADYQATAKGANIKLGNNHKYAQYVSEKIRSGWSPDAIVGDLTRRGEWTVSTPTLYRYIDAGYIPDITNSSLLEKAKRKRKYNHVRKASRAPKGKSISERPKEVNDRCSFGHWEMDSVIGCRNGARQSILVLTERLTRFEIIYRVNNKTALETVLALNRVMSEFPQGTFKSITVDNGSEFQDYYGMKFDKSGNQRAEIYYCHPYTSSERGSNERVNRIIRRFFPKKMDFSTITQAACDSVAEWINTLPRKMLGYLSPLEMFNNHVALLN